MAAPRILVVEDESIVALHLRQQLTKLGYEVPDIVATGDRALHQIETSPPDLVLMDIHLKGEMDGIATASMIPPLQRIPVIYLTAYAEESTLARATATNPYGYLLKPFHERELHAMIQMALARCRAESASNAALEYRRRIDKMTALGQLAGDVAGYFDDLLKVIYGQLEVLGQHAIEHPEIARPIGDTFGEAIEKERLIRRLLAFSGRQKLTPAAVSVNDLIANETTELRNALGDSIQFQVRLPEDLCDAWIDARQLTKALLNLMRNARDAMRDGGGLTIEGQNTTLGPDRTDAEPDASPLSYVLLTVSDTGNGMAEAVVERAFEPFFTTKSASDGLGLSLVFGFVRQSGGDISIDSEPGRGTTVRLWLPVAPGSTAEGELAPLPAGAPPEAGRRRTSGIEAVTNGTTSRSGAGDIRRDSASARNGPPRNGKDLPVAWHTAGDSMFASALSSLGEPLYRLIVEPLPRRNGRDWAVWRPGDTAETSRHGRASSVVTAMAAAEAAARHRATTDPTHNS